jgi:hypothetical protein
MKKYLTLLLTTFLTFQAYSQDVEGLMTRKYITCYDIINNSNFLIPDYFEKNSMDTVAAIINYWEKHCGISEPLLRIKILLSINADTLNENIYSGLPIVNYLINYRENKRNENRGYYYVNYYGVPLISNSFDNFTKKLALQLKKEKVNSELNTFFLDFYSDNFEKIFFRLQDTVLTTSKIKQAYDKEVSRYINLPEGHFSIYSGVWIPNGNISVVGNHPIIGFQGGLKSRRVLIDGVLEFKFGNSPNIYFVEKNDSLYSTTHFFGGYLALELGYELINYKAHEIDVLTGIGWDGFDALSIGNTNDPDRLTKSINALNFNIGIGYRNYFKNKSYIGIDVRYNFVNYQNKNGTDLTGNTFTIRFKYGISRNINRDSNLTRLDNKKIVSSNDKYYEWLRADRRIRYRYQ